MINGTYTPPQGQAGQTTLNFGNGNIGICLGQPGDPLADPGRGNGAWDAYVPVYAGSDCSPSGAQLIIGFATVRITYVGEPGDANNSAQLYRRESVDWLYVPGRFNATCSRGMVGVAEVALERSEPFLASLNNAYDSGGTHACLDSSQSR